MELFTAWLIITSEIERQTDRWGGAERVQTEAVSGDDAFTLQLYVDDTQLDAVQLANGS